MRTLARQAQNLPDIRELAAFCADPMGLDDYLRRYWRYERDPHWTEYVRAPDYQLVLAFDAGYYQGDCDDAATFAGAIVLAMGWPCRFTAYRRAGRDEFSHVNLRCGTNEPLYDVDPTVKLEQLPIVDAERLDCVL